MHKRLLFSILTSFLALVKLTGNAQVQGGVKTENGQPIEVATVTLHRAADSVVVKAEFSDATGQFQFPLPKAGQYRVSASQVGYERTWSGVIMVASEGVALPVLVLKPSQGTTLNEVKIIGQKPLYERLADRTVVNVEGSTLAAGNTSLDVLSRSPGVTIDNNDNLALRGRQNVLVLIDGRRQPMTGTELADYLRNLPADQLKSVELITNPPAKYDAQGTAGIISINLRKDQRLGTNGTLQASYGRSQYDKYTAGVTLNNRRKLASGASLNLFGSYTYANRDGVALLDIHRDFYSLGANRTQLFTGSSNQSNRVLVKSLSHTARAGLDYTPSKRTVLGVVVSGQKSRTPNQLGLNQTSLYDANGRITDTYDARNVRNFVSPNGAINLNLKHTFADSANSPELTADADYAQYKTSRLQELSTVYQLTGRSGTLLIGDQQGDLSILSAKADYLHPLPHQARLEAGAKFSRVSSDNDVVFRLTEGSLTTIDPNRTNRFRYDETILAGYVNWNRSFAKTNLQLGLRAEQTLARGVQSVGNNSFTRQYGQLFPSAAIKQTLSKNHELNLTLSRRINRPSYSQLNPFRTIIDPTTSGAGNPNLRPETSYNLELTHTFKGTFSTGISYSRTTSPMIGVVQPETDSTVISTSVNLDRQDYFALTLVAPVQPAKGWQIYNNVVVYYARFVGNLAGTALDKGRPAFNISSNHTFTFGKGWSGELNGSLQSGEQYGFLRVQPNGQVTIGLQKAVWDRKGTFRLTMSDLFYTRTVTAVSLYDNYVERFYQRQDSRAATLSFSYRFGNDKVAPTRRRTGGAEDEKRRAG
ncbi:TonB-dependent receptor domain-containing protein [Fibrella forsythiae]|uniref:TonB-dependent receptor n=1 Tax=Fibrella forsythiae TaxID=2817061 RepID=A0ABS3JF96_9BACT|nr:TonB-dependent receptor [Fibrella forsythiae]MBO0948663.1 TonB-dependent receptor [Fibrella forsythiae]